MWVFCLHVWLYTTCVPGAYRGLKRVSVWSLGLDFQMAVGCHVVWRTWVQKSKQPVFLTTSISSAQYVFLIRYVTVVSMLMMLHADSIRLGHEFIPCSHR